MHSQHDSVLNNLTKDFTAGAADVAAEYRSQHNITLDPILTSLRETLAYAVGNLATASVVATVTFMVAQNAPVRAQLPSEALQQVPVGFQDEFLRARAEGKKNGITVFRYIQNGNIKGLTDSEQDGIGPGHGKSTSALETAIASKSSRSWEQVRIDALNRALGNQSFNNFSKSINQRQTKAGLPKLTSVQLRNFMDVSFWRDPAQSEPNMAKETGDSEYYQLPKLTPTVRSSLINIKLNYQEQIVHEAVVTYNLTGKRLHDELTSNQDLLAAEAKFVSDHLDAVRFAKPADKTQALLRLGSEPYIRPPETKTSIPPVTAAPPGAPPVTAAPPWARPPIVIPPDAPPVTFVPPDDPGALIPPALPPIFNIPPDSPRVRRRPPVIPPLVNIPPDTEASAPPWNRLVLLVGIPALAILPAIIDDSGDGSNTSASLPTTQLPGDGSNTSASPPTTELPGDGSNTSASPPTTERSNEGFPNTPPSPPTTELPSQGLNTPSSLPTVENPVLSTEEATDVPGAKPIPEPSAILGLAAAGAGLLAAKFKALSKKK